jgi:hypothetical protein
MKRPRLDGMSVDGLVERFAESCLRQFKAELESSIPKQNRCVEEQMAIADELKTRAGDQRRALLKLYDHPNVQVRLNAARLSWALAPSAARDVVEKIAHSKQQPQAMDAGMCLWTLEQGIFKPA